MNQDKKMAQESIASANDNPTGADINNKGLLPGQQLGQSAPKLEALPTSLYALSNNAPLQSPETGLPGTLQTETPVAPPNPTFSPAQTAADPDANSQKLSLVELSANGDQSLGQNENLEVSDPQSVLKAPELMTSRQGQELEVKDDLGGNL